MMRICLIVIGLGVLIAMELGDAITLETKRA